VSKHAFPALRFDGHGINSDDGYCDRIATFTESHKAMAREGLGQLLAASPDLLAACQAVSRLVGSLPAFSADVHTQVVDAIRRATGQDAPAASVGPAPVTREELAEELRSWLAFSGMDSKRTRDLLTRLTAEGGGK